MADIVFPGVPAGGPLGQDYLPANYDLVLYKGDYLPFAVTLKDSTNAPLDLTGFTAKCSIRSNYDAVVSYDATCTITPAAGKVDILFPSSLTETMDAGNYIWDFQITDPDENNRTYFTGDVTVYDEVTV
ncbi:hypothetical protein SEA_MOAB_30 [Streptomyces phage Moab]|nr:hypothetical protein SEA_MOAB_30 [Streptomyces phage Moab]WMI33663.1 tail fiber [Streptomyces phage Patelgo]